MGEFLSVLFIVVLVIAAICLAIFCIRIPIIVAKRRNIVGEELKTISILSWVSIIVGVTWPVALILALLYKPKNWIDKDENMSLNDLERLDKLSDLKNKGVISDEEFEKEKANILGK